MSGGEGPSPRIGARLFAALLALAAGVIALLVVIELVRGVL